MRIPVNALRAALRFLGFDLIFILDPDASPMQVEFIRVARVSTVATLESGKGTDGLVPAMRGWF